MPVILNNFQKGQSSSPYLLDGAFSKSQNLDVFSQKGIARINYLPTTSGATAPLDLVINFSRAYNSATTFYGADTSTNVYTIDPTANPHTVTKFASQVGQYVLGWKGYILGFGNSAAVIKYWDSSNWVALTGNPSFGGATNHFYLNSLQDGKIYFCDESSISTLEEVAGQNFDPTDINTFDWNNNVFKLPEHYQAAGLAEMGIYIIIAAINYDSIANVEQKNPVTTYFFWDRSAGTADKIITIPIKRMTNMLGVGDRIFITGNDEGHIYQLTESGFELYAQIPFDYGGAKTVQIGGLGYPSMAWWRNMLLVGVSSTDGLSPAGIYGIQNGKPVHLFLPSEGKDGSDKDILIGGIYPYDDTTLYFAWENDTDNTYGIDEVITSANRVGSYEAYLESIFYPVGTRGSKKSFDKVEVQLARPLQTGEGVRIKWRKNINDSWTTLGTQTFATNGAVSSLEFPGIHNLENIQVRYEATTGSTTNTPLLLEIRLLP